MLVFSESKETISHISENLLKHGFVSCPLGQYKDVLDGTFSNETNLKYRDQNLQNAKSPDRADMKILS